MYWQVLIQGTPCAAQDFTDSPNFTRQEARKCRSEPAVTTSLPWLLYGFFTQQHLTWPALHQWKNKSHPQLAICPATSGVIPEVAAWQESQFSSCFQAHNENHPMFQNRATFRDCWTASVERMVWSENLGHFFPKFAASSWLSSYSPKKCHIFGGIPHFRHTPKS